MPTLTVDRFEIGIDRRKGRVASDANRLWDAKNVYVNNGRHLTKRPGLTYIGAFSGDGVGLFSAKGYLNDFQKGTGSATVIGSGPLRECEVTYASAQALARTWFVTNFGGSLMLLGELADGDLVSAYDSTATPNDILNAEITDVNCPTVGTNPDNPCAIALTEKIYMGNDTQVNFCATATLSDWTTASDAGSINASRQALGSQEVKALGQYQGTLIIFFEDSAQAWQVDTDPAYNILQQSIDGVGCRYPLSVGNLSSDVFFLAKQGFKSISLLSLTNNLADVDVGTPIDPLVRVSLASLTGEPVAVYNPRGQYMCAIDNDIYVYSFSRTAKISAWSRYDFGMPVDYWASHEGEVYFRSGDDVWMLDVDQTQDEDSLSAFASFEATATLAYLDCKKPGRLKYFHSCDVVQEGTCDLRFRYQYIDDNGDTQEATTDWITDLKGNSRVGDLIPIEVCATAIAPEFSCNNDSAWELHAISLHYEDMDMRF